MKIIFSSSLRLNFAITFFLFSLVIASSRGEEKSAFVTRFQTLSSAEQQLLILDELPDAIGNYERFDLLTSLLNFNSLTLDQSDAIARFLLRFEERMRHAPLANRRFSPPGQSKEDGVAGLLEIRLKELLIPNDIGFQKGGPALDMKNWLQKVADWPKANPEGALRIKKAIAQNARENQS